MKQIKIVFRDADPIVANDDDDRALEDYMRELSKLLENNNVSILHTTSESVIIRPNAISAVVVTNTDKPEKELTKKDSSTKKKIKTESVDIITD